MKVTRLDLPVMASLMEENGRRLDCNPYLSGGFEARVLLKKLDAEKQPLKDLTAGGLKGIFNGPRFPRHYVQDPAHGVPFLGSTDILAADLSGLPMISKKQVKARPELVIDQDWTLITCSGTIGRMVYSRADMKGMAGSQHFMRIVADRTKILPGYLYAYLSSRFGVALIVSGTYGSIIQHLEPSHIADLPVPRLGDAIEQKIHDLITEAAEIRTKANQDLHTAINTIQDLANLPPLESIQNTSPDISTVISSELNNRLDGLFHSNFHRSALQTLKNLPEEQRITVGQLATKIFEPTRFKRVQLDDTSYGVPFFGTTALMWNDPVPSYYIPNKQGNSDEYIVDDKTVLIPRSGQLSGLIGHAVLPYGALIGGAISEHAIRVVLPSSEIAGYLFLALASEYGKRQLKARAYGSSIPTLDVNMIQQVIIPKLTDKLVKELGKVGHQISCDRTTAIQKEEQARNILESFIEQPQ
jgi:type I restriction enzyme, S subunit